MWNEWQLPTCYQQFSNIRWPPTRSFPHLMFAGGLSSDLLSHFNFLAWKVQHSCFLCRWIEKVWIWNNIYEWCLTYLTFNKYICNIMLLVMTINFQNCPNSMKIGLQWIVNSNLNNVMLMWLRILAPSSTSQFR